MLNKTVLNLNLACMDITRTYHVIEYAHKPPFCIPLLRSVIVAYRGGQCYDLLSDMFPYLYEINRSSSTTYIVVYLSSIVQCLLKFISSYILVRRFKYSKVAMNGPVGKLTIHSYWPRLTFLPPGQWRRDWRWTTDNKIIQRILLFRLWGKQI